MSRYERKYIANPYSPKQLDIYLKTHPYHFSEIYHERMINNIYFDTFDLSKFYGTQFGSLNRVKYRIRWYGDMLGRVEKPVLELKIKSNLLGTKESYPLKPFTIDNNFSRQTIIDVLKESDLPVHIYHKMLGFRYTLLNRYRRRYYLSLNKKFRVTIDSDLEFTSLNTCKNLFLNKLKHLNDVILELKYDYSDNKTAGNIASHFPFNLSKFSKYSKGIELLTGITDC